MALPAGVTQLGTFKGAKGDKGLTGTLAYATVETVPADQPASVEMIGPENNRGAHFRVSRGLPGPGAIENDEAIATYIGADDSETATALMRRYVSSVTMAGPGIDPTGVTDSTVAMQAIIDANPNGQIYVPAGVYKFTTLRLDAGQLLFGVGRSTYRDRYSVFGTPGWLDDANFGGAVLRSTAATGTAITIVDPTEVTEGGLLDLTLIGPGSGAAVGVQIGGISPIKSTVNPKIRNVAIGNFATGAQLAYVNEGVFDGWTFRGCQLAIEFVAAVNHNVFTGLDIQWCGDGVRIAIGCYANTFLSPIFQSDSGVAVRSAGTKTAFYNPYFENIGQQAMIISGMGNKVDSPFINDVGDIIQIDAGASENEIENFGWQGAAGAIVDNGSRTRISGRTNNVSGTGTGRVVIDPGEPGTPFGLWKGFNPTLGGTGWAIGNGTIVASYTRIGRTIHERVLITFGSTSTFGSASPTVSLPTDAVPQSRGMFEAVGVRNGVGSFRLFPRISAIGGSAVLINAMGANGQGVAMTATTPAAWASGDTLEVYGTYEATLL